MDAQTGLQALNRQRQAESLAPEILFLQGIPFDPTELQRSFRYVGVRPPEISPPTVESTVFLDEGLESYRLLLEGKLDREEAYRGREESWAKRIRSALNASKGTALIRSGREHLDRSANPFKRLVDIVQKPRTGALPKLLRDSGIRLQVARRVLDINEVFGKR
jgi:hypothetical protein